MIKGFRDFILRGNVIDLAVAVVIGAAFTALVNSITTNLIQPIINVFLGGLGATGGEIPIGSQTINLGAMFTALITFLITAAVVYFVFVAPMNAWKNKFGDKQQEETDEEIALLREIRDALVSGRDPSS